MSGAQAEIRSGLAGRTATAEAMFVCFWLLMFLGCGVVAIAIKDSEQLDHELALQRAHAAGMDAGYKLCKSEGR